MNAWRQWFGGLSLSSKMVLVMLLLLLLVQLAGWGVVRQVVDRQVRAEVEASLQVAERLWMRQLLQNAARLRDAAVVLAADFGFRSAIATDDVETIASALENVGGRIGAGVVAFLDPTFVVLSAAQSPDERVTATLELLAKDLAANRNEGRLATVVGRPHLFVIVPVRAPLTVGWVLIGFPLDQTVVDDFWRLSGVHAVLLAADAGQPLAVTVGSWPGDRPAVLEAARQPTPPETVEDKRVALRKLPLESVAGEVGVVLMRPLDELLAPYERLQWLLGLITLSAVALFALVSKVAARRVTTPLYQLTQVTRALEEGAYDVQVPGKERGDEVGALARGFESMRASIAEQREEILRLAYWDRLTGLPNREQFRHTLQQRIGDALSGAMPMAVITLNVDRFKHVNDVLGYAFGDELLKAVAERLRSQVTGDRDLVARLGGDEFAILLCHADAAGADAMVGRLRAAFEQPLALGDQTVDLSASMGVARFPQDANEADALMSRCEIAMHAAKSSTAGVLHYAPALDSSSAQTLSLLSDLRTALKDGELRLYLQPKLQVASRKVVAAEALVRWLHPKRGLVPPMEFIPFAEQTGFVRQLTLWMFEEAARQWHALQPVGGRLRIAINLSTRDLLDLDFPQRLVDIMARQRVQADGFCLEITESAIMDDPQRAEATLNRLAELGFKLSIDDFG
ncbi:MAG: diguanylate cyclase, partial [Burkholderiaceae bacterium]|nr:diguanylate cyclase [Burkholderiaceae bacterium]